MKRFVRIFFASIMAISLLGCGKQTGISVSSRLGEVTPSGIKLGGVLRMNEEETPRSLDPVRIGDSASHDIGTQLFDGLLNFNNQIELEPGIAERYEISNDGLTYTFYLRKGVSFHDNPCFPDGKGREVKAEDVKYSFTRVLNPENQSTGVWLFDKMVEGASEYLNGQADEVTGFQAIDDYTFQLRLIKPFGPFIYRIAMAYGFIVPREAVEYYGKDFFQHPVGTGPFRFVHWKPGQEILLARNEQYWKRDKDGVQLPYLDGIRISRINDFKISFLEFDVGNLDFIKQIHEDVWSKVFDNNNQVRPEYQKYQILSKPLWVLQYFGFNLTQPPFKDNHALRQAINYAVDREAIIQYVMNGRGQPANGVVPVGIPGYRSDVEGYSYNPDKAKELLAQAGYPNGEGLGEIVLQLNSGGTVNESIAEAVQEQLRKVGINIRLQVMDWAQHLENVDNNKAIFFRMGWVADYPDPENFLQLLWSKSFSPEGPNHSRYSNPEFDRIYEEAITIADTQKRFELYRQAEKIAVDDAPWLFLFFTTRYHMAQPYVKNYVLNPQELPILTEVWLDK